MPVVDELGSAVAAAWARQARVLVAVDGPDAAGKTTMADELARLLGDGVVRASIDGFHHPRATRLRRGELSAEGYFRDSFDLVALTSMLLRPFATGARQVHARVFDFQADVRVGAAPTVVAERAVLVFDGVFLLRPELRAWWDLAIYLDVSPQVSLQRALVRDVSLFGSQAAVRRRYAQRYLPGQQLYRDEVDPLSLADLVVDNDDPARAVLRAR